MRISDWSSDVCSSDLTDGNDQVAMEKTQYPWRTYNLHLGFTYKNIGFSALLYGVTDVGYAFPERLYWDFRGGHVSAFPDVVDRSEERRVGKECVSRWRCGW